MQANPWFSTERPDEDTPPETAAFYHNNLCCTQGKKVGKYHHRYGTDNRTLCPRCIMLNAAGR